MPAVLEPRQWCVCNVRWEKKVTGSKGDTYTVSFGEHVPGPYAANWECSCPGFKYYGDCKHIRQTKTEKCCWGEGAAWGSPERDIPEDGKCPECGSDIVTVIVAV